jgi:DNA-directed RNA polymerase subunit RPC12/RpoP
MTLDLFCAQCGKPITLAGDTPVWSCEHEVGGAVTAVPQTTQHTCAECGGPVDVLGGQIVRDCGHDTAGVLASVSTTLVGQSCFMVNRG